MLDVHYLEFFYHCYLQRTFKMLNKLSESSWFNNRYENLLHFPKLQLNIMTILLKLYEVGKFLQFLIFSPTERC